MTAEDLKNAANSPVHWLHTVVGLKPVTIAAVLDIHSTYVSQYLAGKKPSTELSKKMASNFRNYIEELKDNVQSLPPKNEIAKDYAEELIRTSEAYASTL